MSDIQAIIKQLTLMEKATMTIGNNPWSTVPSERLNIPSVFVSDGPHGIRRVADVTKMDAPSIPATCFPTASCQSATWNPALVKRMGEALSEECIALKVDVLLGPGTNMKRTPLCGRNFEYYAEDPYLSGHLTVAYIKGVQSKGVGTSLKHYAVNNQEFERFCISAEVDERTLREIYLPAFEMAVKEAQPWTVMCAYNRINGIYASEHHALLTKILRREWGFKGLIVSDWGAVHDRVAALQAGIDLEMPGPKPQRAQAIVEAVEAGTLSESILDEAVACVLNLAFQVTATPKGGQFNVTAHHTLAREIASEGIVLLKNDGLLPLQQPQRIAVIGRTAKTPHIQGGGSSHVNPTKLDIPFDQIAKLAPQAKLSYAPGYPQDFTVEQDLIDEAVTLAQNAEVALVFVALPRSVEAEGYDRSDLRLTPHQDALLKAVTSVQPRTVVILNTGSPVEMSDWLDGAAAVVEAWLMGQGGGAALADILFGKVNPSGKLAETFPHKLSDTPAHLTFPGERGRVSYSEGLFIGYRYYDAKEMPVLFPFGHGLSYTTFTYNNPQVSATTIKDVDGLTLTVDITNTGDMAGQEIVQLYVQDCEASLIRPLKELKGFAKIDLQPGETKSIAFTLDFRTFAFYHPGHEQWITEDGQFKLLVGASATDIRCSQTITLQSTLNLPSLLHTKSTPREWLADPRGKPVIETMMVQLNIHGRPLDEEEEGGANAMDRRKFMLDTPLLSLLHFEEGRLPQTPEEIVEGLLKQVADG